MACRGFCEWLLKLLNFLLAVAGLAMVGYGVYLLVEWIKISGGGGAPTPLPPLTPDSPPAEDFFFLGRPMLAAFVLGDNFYDLLPKAWFIYLFIGVGATVFLISLCGCITKNRCCLCSYAFFVVLLILIEIGAAAFIFFDKSWQDVVPDDKTKNFDTIFQFLNSHWEIARWVALGVVVFEGLLFLLALVVRAMYKQPSYDSDDEYLGTQQPLVHRQNVPATGIPVPVLEQRPSRNDAWSQRMREKYGLDTSEFSYNPANPNRYQQSGAPPAENGGGCTIL